MHVVFHGVEVLSQLVGPSVLSAQLHTQLLVFWPYLIAEMRRQRRAFTESPGASEPSGQPPGTRLFRLKVHIHTWHTHVGLTFIIAFMIAFDGHTHTGPHNVICVSVVLLCWIINP